MTLFSGFIFLFWLALLLGITLWLPVGSTAMVQLFSAMDPSQSALYLNGAQSVFTLAASVVLLYAWRSFFKDRKVWARLAALSLPPLLAWCVLASRMPALLEEPVVTVILMMASGAILMVVSRLHAADGAPDVRSAFAAGCTGCLGMLPGYGLISALLTGLAAAGKGGTAAYQYACLGALPVMIVKSVSQLVSADMSAFAGQNLISLVVCTILVIILTFTAIRFASLWFRRHTVFVFGVFRIAAGIVMLLIYMVF